MDYNEYYNKAKDVFGKDPEKILVKYHHLISKEKPVLDIGAGQGRNTVYLAELGYKVEAIDTSPVSIKFLKEIKEEQELSFNTSLSGFENYSGLESYSAILLFGLIQILDWTKIDLLKRKLSNWLKDGGLLFITAFTTSDKSYKTISENSIKIGKNSYLRPDGEERTFFEPGEIRNLFRDYKIIHYWEGLGPEHRHGNSPIERHEMVEAVFQK